MAFTLQVYGPGARFLKRAIEDRIKLPISHLWTQGQSFVADVRDGQIELEIEAAPGGMAAFAATA